MKKLIPFLILLISIPFLWAQDGNQINLVLSPNYVFYNSLNASSFDPQQPTNQPFFFSLQISNLQQLPYAMRIKFEWNGNQLFDTNLIAAELQPSLIVTNQTLLSSNASMYFHSPNPSIDLQEIFDSNKDFKEAIVNTGRFPDGSYLFTMQAVTPDGSNMPMSGSVSFRMEIQNANAIYLQNPGVLIGGMLPTYGTLPLTFLWNSNLVGIMPTGDMPGLGKFTMTIKEFNEIDEIQPDIVESGPVFRIIPDINGTVYTGYIPFQSGKYYAWQISTPLATTNNQENLTLKSQWYAFKYSNEVAAGGTGTGGGGAIGGTSGSGSTGGSGVTGGTGEIGGTGGTGQGGTSGGTEGGTGGTTVENEILIILTNLNNPQINGLLNDEFRPTGNVFVGDQLYSGNSALIQLQRLSGKTIKSITVSDE